MAFYCCTGIETENEWMQGKSDGGAPVVEVKRKFSACQSALLWLDIMIHDFFFLLFSLLIFNSEIFGRILVK